MTLDAVKIFIGVLPTHGFTETRQRIPRNAYLRHECGGENKNLPLVAYYRVVVETEDKSVPLLRIGRERLMGDAL